MLGKLINHKQKGKERMPLVVICPWTPYVANPKQYFSIGYDLVLCMIFSIENSKILFYISKDILRFLPIS